jgi:peptidyl-prolyl cis-trans isomerase SurA
MHTDLPINPPAPSRPRSSVRRLFLLSALCLVAHWQPALAAEPIDRIVAVVNDEVITESELNARLDEVGKRIAAQKISAPPENILKKQVLERTILEHLQLQLAQQMNIEAGKDKVDAALENIAEQNHMSLPELYKTVEHDGISQDAFREQIHNQIIIQQLVEREIGNRISVSDAEVENFLANSENLDGGTEYELSHILITLPESATPEVIQRTRQHADEVLRGLRQGGAFDQAAIANSQGENALEGGKLGWKKTGQLPTLFVNALKTMQPGDVSDVLRSPGGFHILKLLDKRGGKKNLTITQTHTRHILLRTNEIVTPQDAWQRLNKLRLRIQNGDDFAALAKANSEDPGSASNGGDLGWVNPGQTVPEFEKAMNALKINEISAPIQTPFGLHLIQVLERRQHDITNERDQADARQQIHARKTDERYAQWVRQLRDEAYIEYRIKLE